MQLRSQARTQHRNLCLTFFHLGLLNLYCPLGLRLQHIELRFIARLVRSTLCLRCRQLLTELGCVRFFRRLWFPESPVIVNCARWIDIPQGNRCLTGQIPQEGGVSDGQQGF